MENAQNSFISSTFWTERIGPTAALATLDEMRKLKSWEITDNNGKKIISRWRNLEKKYDLKMDIFGFQRLN